MTFRRWFMCVLLGSTAASLAGNIAAATLLPHGGAALPTAVVIAVASVAPLALPVAVHSVPIAARAAGMVRAVVVVSVAVVSVAAFAMSFDALARLAHAAGHSGWVGALLPVTLDVLAGASAVALVLDPERHATATDNHHAAVPAADVAPAPPSIASWAAAPPATSTAGTASPATVPAASSQPVGEAAVPVADTAPTGGDAVADAGGHPAPGLHLVPGGEGAGEPADRHLAAAKAALAAGVVVKPPVPVAARALRLRAAGESQRAVAEQLGIDRSVVARLEAFAEELAEQEAVV